MSLKDYFIKAVRSMFSDKQDFSEELRLRKKIQRQKRIEERKKEIFLATHQCGHLIPILYTPFKEIRLKKAYIDPNAFIRELINKEISDDQCQTVEGGVDFEIALDPSNQAHLEWYITMLFCGQAATEWKLGRCDGAEDDLVEINRLLKLLYQCKTGRNFGTDYFDLSNFQAQEFYEQNYIVPSAILKSRAKNLLISHEPDLDNLTNALANRRILDAADIYEIVGNAPFPLFGPAF